MDAHAAVGRAALLAVLDLSEPRRVHSARYIARRINPLLLL